MSGYCAQGLHNQCPDTIKDTWACECTCHLLEDETPEKKGVDK